LCASRFRDKTPSVAAQELHAGLILIGLAKAALVVMFCSTLVACTKPMIPVAHDAHKLSTQDKKNDTASCCLLSFFGCAGLHGPAELGLRHTGI
jgi:hypothetical protein